MFTVTLTRNDVQWSEQFNSLAEARAFVVGKVCDEVEITDGDRQYEIAAPALN